MMDENKIEINENGEKGEVVSEVIPETGNAPTPEATTETESTEAVTEADDKIAEEGNEADGEPEAVEEAPAEAVYAFRWDYSEQYAHDKGESKKQEKKNLKGAIGYASVMVAVFVLAFAILFAAMSFDDLASWFNPPEGYSAKEVSDLAPRGETAEKFAGGRECFTVRGICRGTIITKARGKGGFGYDPYFYLPKTGKTMAELSPSEKSSISHRGNAMRLFIPALVKVIK